MVHLILGIHILLCVALVVLVLLQQGKGASMGAAFGGANSQTVFGAAGAGNMLTKITTGIAVAFMFTSILLVRHYGSLADSEVAAPTDLLEGSVMQQVQAVPAEGVAEPISPAAPAASGSGVAAEAAAPSK